MIKQNKTLLIVADAQPNSIELYYHKYLNIYGIKSEFFQPSKYYTLNLLNKARLRLGNISFYARVNSELINYCNLSKPTYLWVFKGVEIFPSTLERLKKMGILLINYNPDHPFIRTSIAHGAANIPMSVPIYDIYFSYRKDLVQEIKTKYKVATEWLPFGFELDAKQYSENAKLQEINKVCFIGTPDKERTEQLIKIANQGFKIDLYSLTYPDKKKLQSHKNIELFSVVLNNEFWQTMYKYRVHLNFLREHNIGSHNQRTFETPGAGAILLTPKNEEQMSFFEPNDEMFFYDDSEDLCSQLEMIQSFSFKNANEVRNNARARSINSQYSYEHRSLVVHDTLLKF